MGALKSPKERIFSFYSLLRTLSTLKLEGFDQFYTDLIKKDQLVHKVTRTCITRDINLHYIA
jgi:hypothetical protein